MKVHYAGAEQFPKGASVMEGIGRGEYSRPIRVWKYRMYGYRVDGLQKRSRYPRLLSTSKDP
ncbi:hypothetical protein D3C71_1289490 [compost metagenome]